MGMGKTRSRLPLAAAMLVGVTAASALAIEIPEGTHVLMRLENTVTTRTAQPGDNSPWIKARRDGAPMDGGNAADEPSGPWASGVQPPADRGLACT